MGRRLRAAVWVLALWAGGWFLACNTEPARKEPPVDRPPPPCAPKCTGEIRIEITSESPVTHITLDVRDRDKNRRVFDGDWNRGRGPYRAAIEYGEKSSLQVTIAASFKWPGHSVVMHILVVDTNQGFVGDRGPTRFYDGGTISLVCDHALGQTSCQL